MYSLAFFLCVLPVLCQREIRVAWSHAQTAISVTTLKYDSKESGTEKS